jgi:prephenate dehydratase
MHYVETEGIKKYKVKYLYTTERVLSELHKGNIDYGQFAIHNSVGGIVDESIQAIARYKFRIVTEYGIKIEHHLMKRRDASFGDIKNIMAHDQVFKQRHSTLAEKYSNFKQVTGKGDLIDTAMAAKALSEGKIDKNTAILGPGVLSALFDLEIVDSNLQDNKENYTSFMMVKRT